MRNPRSARRRVEDEERVVDPETRGEGLQEKLADVGRARILIVEFKKIVDVVPLGEHLLDRLGFGDGAMETGPFLILVDPDDDRVLLPDIEVRRSCGLAGDHRQAAVLGDVRSQANYIKQSGEDGKAGGAHRSL